MENLSGQPRGGRNVAAPPKENFFFLDWPTRILYSRLDSCQDFEKAAGGRTAAVKMPRDSKPRAVRSELYRDNPVTHIELYVRVCVSLLEDIHPLPLPPSKRKSEKTKSTRRAINRRSNPALSVRFEGKRLSP